MTVLFGPRNFEVQITHFSKTRKVVKAFEKVSRQVLLVVGLGVETVAHFRTFIIDIRRNT